MSARKSSASRDVRQEILHHWRETGPNDRLAHLVRDSGRACVRALQLRLVAHGVSFGHWIFLRILWDNDGLMQRELSVRAGVREPTTFAALGAMEAQGYLLRKHASDNRKNIYVTLTAKGRALRKTLEPLAEEVNRVAVSNVSAKDIAATRKTLLAIIENLAQDELASGK